MISDGKALDIYDTYGNRTIKETISLSLNYYKYHSVDIDVSVPGKKSEALTIEGCSIYSLAHNSFCLECGDKYVTKYKKGKILLLSIVADFSSPFDKGRFEQLSSIFTSGSKDIVSAV